MAKAIYVNTGEQMHWRVNTCGLLKEIQVNKGTAILAQPLQIFANILGEVAARALELNDPQMNALMCRLALYEQSDPYSPQYDKKLTEKTINAFY